MADSVSNPKGIVEKGINAVNDFVVAEQPDNMLAEQFSGLLASSGEEGFRNPQEGVLPPSMFSDFEQGYEVLPPVENPENSEQAGFGRGQDAFTDSIEVRNREAVGDSIWGNTGQGALESGSPVRGNIEMASDSGTLGDQILKGMQGIREQVEKGARDVESHLQPSDEVMSMREMFETQWTMTNLMITEDFIGKIVSKGTQAFDTLLRNQ
ncbi:MAG: EscI/YscI/HrpB family type III secretion system inner rod protein [Candidatus Endonucleobacter bathymodioli]|uniref:EscI/YscI/HrpB family type III secretion system inner rod protein n=1 Tax=Candidatus Endonucleibacter bathymodioli TaxID=539814 RepID=A0AA90NRY3_9GAMM|nr:EscI/YscI/HrpB family type III secretion system inner rod protein [Candidatus Endonucleobacter bathymodioli]